MAKPRTYEKERRATVIMDAKDYEAFKELARAKGLPFSRMVSMILKNILNQTQARKQAAAETPAD